MLLVQLLLELSHLVAHGEVALVQARELVSHSILELAELLRNLGVLLVDNLGLACELSCVGRQRLRVLILRLVGALSGEVFVHASGLVIVVRFGRLVALNLVVVALSVGLRCGDLRLVQQNLLAHHLVGDRLRCGGRRRRLVSAKIASDANHKLLAKLHIIGPKHIAHRTVARSQLAQKVKLLIVKRVLLVHARQEQLPSNRERLGNRARHHRHLGNILQAESQRHKRVRNIL